MNIMTKRGNLDNIVTYEHICDTTADIENIDPKYATLGSTAIVLQNEDGMLTAYMANSDHEWIPIMVGGSGGGGGNCSCVHLVLEESEVESGGGGGDIKGTRDGSADIYQLNYSYEEIEDAMKNGTVVFYQEESQSTRGDDSSTYTYVPVQAIGYKDSNYFVSVYGQDETITWTAADKADNPTRSAGSSLISDDTK